VGTVRLPSTYRVNLKVVLADGEVIAAKGETYGGSIGDALDNFEPETLKEALGPDLTDEPEGVRRLEVIVEKIA
jgi:hypothetical protein